MPRQQVSYTPTKTQTSPSQFSQAVPIAPRQEQPGGLGFQLAKALGVHGDELAGSLNRLDQAQEENERKAAQAYANSITVEDLGKRIKDGSMLPSQSPAFHAALQHIYGENTANNIERDTLSKLSSGELKFNTQADLEKHLVDARNEALSGQSEYTTHGFDKGWTAMRERLSNAQAQVSNQEAVQRGIQESSDNLGNHLLEVSSPTFKGTKEDAAKSLVGRYQLLRKTSLLRDDAAKEALSNLLGNASAGGDKELVANLLDQKLDSGVTVKAVMGDILAESFKQRAEQAYDKGQHQRVDVEIRPFVEQADKGALDSKRFDAWITANEPYVTTATIHAITSANGDAIEHQRRELARGAALAAVANSEARATQMVRMAADQGTLAFLPQQQVLTKDGDSKDFNHKAAAIEYMAERTRGWPLDKQVVYWSTNGIENPEWQKQINAGISNLASVGWAHDGKNLGQLNEQGQAAVAIFAQVNMTNPAYAQALAGEKNYKTLSDIQFLVERGHLSLSDAAARVNQAERIGLSSADYGSLVKKVDAAVNDVVDPHWYSGMSRTWGGWWGNDQVNLTSIKGDIRRMSELLVRTGQVPDAATAVQQTVEYLARPAITSRINNTVYFNKDLPTPPKGEPVDKLMERFIKEVPGKVAEGHKMSTSELRLEPNQYGGFTAWHGGVPLIDDQGNVVQYTKTSVSQWMDSTVKADRSRAQADAQYGLFKERLNRELDKQQSDKMHPDSFVAYKRSVLTSVGSRESYDALVKEGLQEKPVTFLWKRRVDQLKASRSF
jgi:hypothetical protein